MSAKPPANHGLGQTGLFKRVVRADQRQSNGAAKKSKIYFNRPMTSLIAQEQDMLTGVLEVAETQVREVMIPRSQMIVIERDQDLA